MSSKKGKKPKGVTISFQEFTARVEGEAAPNAGQNVVYAPKKPTLSSWADEVEEDEQITAKERIVLPSAPRASRGPAYDDSEIPKSAPFQINLGNLNYDIDDEDIYKFFRDLDIIEVKLPRDHQTNRIKGFGFVVFNTRDDLITALIQNEQMLRGRPVRIALGQDRVQRDGGRGESFRNNRPPPEDEGVDNWRDVMGESMGAGRPEYPPMRSEKRGYDDNNKSFRRRSPSADSNNEGGGTWRGGQQPQQQYGDRRRQMSPVDFSRDEMRGGGGGGGGPPPEEEEFTRPPVVQRQEFHSTDNRRDDYRRPPRSDDSYRNSRDDNRRDDNYRGGRDDNRRDDNYRGGRDDNYRGRDDNRRGGDDNYRGGRDDNRRDDNYRGGRDDNRRGDDNYRVGRDDNRRGGDDNYRGGGRGDERPGEEEQFVRPEVTPREVTSEEPQKQRKKLVLAPRSVTASSTTESGSSSIFGGAKPVDTTKRELEIEEKIEKLKLPPTEPATPTTEGQKPYRVLQTAHSQQRQQAPPRRLFPRGPIQINNNNTGWRANSLQRGRDAGPRSDAPRRGPNISTSQEDIDRDSHSEPEDDRDFKMENKQMRGNRRDNNYRDIRQPGEYNNRGRDYRGGNSRYVRGQQQQQYSRGAPPPRMQQNRGRYRDFEGDNASSSSSRRFDVQPPPFEPEKVIQNKFAALRDEVDD